VVAAVDPTEDQPVLQVVQPEVMAVTELAALAEASKVITPMVQQVQQVLEQAAVVHTAAHSSAAMVPLVQSGHRQAIVPQQDLAVVVVVLGTMVPRAVQVDYTVAVVVAL
jgi:hypothetical protein